MHAVGALVIVKNLLTSPSDMSLSGHEMTVYQNVLKHAAPLSLNLMAVKITNRPDDFCGWCEELIDVCRNRVNFDLLDDDQLKPLKKLGDILAAGISISRLRMATIAPWPFYVEFIKGQSEVQALEERTRLLNYTAKLNETSLASMIEDDRLAYAGKHGNNHDPLVYDFDVQWFGSTKAAKAFHQLLANNAELFDQALANIPLQGEVTRDEYDAFVTAYSEAFASIDEKAPLVPATRLLAMRRPDQFVVLTSAKLSEYSQGLEIKLGGAKPFASYWTGLILTVRQMHWWRSSEPEDQQELFYWQHRAILLDMFLYADDSMAQKSNYLKLLNKPKRTSAGSTTKRMRRSKESAEALVDRVLLSEELPDFVKAQRLSIISQVQGGKSIDEVISLIKKIFG